MKKTPLANYEPHDPLNRDQLVSLGVNPIYQYQTRQEIAELYGIDFKTLVATLKAGRKLPRRRLASFRLAKLLSMPLEHVTCHNATILRCRSCLFS